MENKNTDEFRAGDSNLLDADAVAELLHCSKDNVFDLKNNHDLPFTVRGGRLRFELERVKEWAKKHGVSLDNGDRLKSCPFCGSCAMLVCEKTDGEILYHVECQNVFCGIRTPDSSDRKDAIDSWNCRQEEDSEEQIQEGAK